jgi:hypothetical protein
MESKRKILYDTIEKSCINFKHLNNKNKLAILKHTQKTLTLQFLLYVYK